MFVKKAIVDRKKFASVVKKGFVQPLNQAVTQKKADDPHEASFADTSRPVTLAEDDYQLE